MKTAIGLIIAVACLTGCVTNGVRQGDAQTVGQANADTQRKLRFAEVSYAKKVALDVQRALPGARADLDIQGDADALPGVVHERLAQFSVVPAPIVRRVVIDIPVAHRGSPAYLLATRQINDYVRSLAMWRGASTLENLRNPADARREKFAPDQQSTPIEEGGTITLVKRIDSTVPASTIRFVLTPAAL